jgi:hypothetical protein
MQRTLTRRKIVVIFNALGLASAAGSLGAVRAWAAPLPQPQGKVILTISGRITNTNNGNSAEFDMPMLEAIGIESFTTKTPWYKDPVTFSGVPMARLLAFVGATGSSLRHCPQRLCDRDPRRGFQDAAGDAGDQARRRLHAGQGQGAPVHRLQLRLNRIAAPALQPLGVAVARWSSK